jgi:hypothetical protein
LSDRYVLIQQGLKEEGKLNREIEKTKNSMELLNEYSQKLKYKRQKKTTMLTDFLLFFFAATSAAEIFFDLPIFNISFDDTAKFGTFVLIIVFGYLIYRTNK